MCARPPQEVATLLNILMLEEMQSDLYFTIVLGYLDLATGGSTSPNAAIPTRFTCARAAAAAITVTTACRSG